MLPIGNEVLLTVTLTDAQTKQPVVGATLAARLVDRAGQIVDGSPTSLPHVGDGLYQGVMAAVELARGQSYRLVVEADGIDFVVEQTHTALNRKV